MNLANKRIFLAIEVSEEWKDAINQFINANKELNYRWIPEQNWHFTLLFIGDFPEDKLNYIYPLLQKCFSEVPAFEIVFEAFTYFPPNKPRMIWAKGKPNNAFAFTESSAYKTLKHFCEDEDMEIHAKPSKKSIPHITLSRLKFAQRNWPVLKSPEVKISALKVTEIVLFSSALKPGGAKYTSLAQFKLST